MMMGVKCRARIRCPGSCHGLHVYFLCDPDDRARAIFGPAASLGGVLLHQPLDAYFGELLFLVGLILLNARCRIFS
jgi:hypothetical protein